MTMTGVILALFFRRDILDNTVVLSFALGVMLASGIFSLLIPSITMLKTNNTGFYPLYIGVAIGIAIIVIVGVWFIFAKVLKNKKPKEVTLKDIPIDLEALIHALGGIDNIKESQSQGSKVRFFVENDDLVKVNVLKELGASGVIQATGKVTVILGKFSDEISRIVNEKK